MNCPGHTTITLWNWKGGQAPELPLRDDYAVSFWKRIVFDRQIHAKLR